jgi:hypothetical protein
MARIWDGDWRIAKRHFLRERQRPARRPALGVLCHAIKAVSEIK